MEKEIKRDIENNDNWEICLLTEQEGQPELSKEDEIHLCTDWEFNDKENEVQSIATSRSNLVIAKMRGDGVLAKWREEQNKLISEKKTMMQKSFIH